MELTEVKFWENYWQDFKLPAIVDINFSFERCLANALKENITINGGEIFEVGCAPGKWLAFMANEFALKPNGIEYSDAGVDATIENFNYIGINPGYFKTGDFLKIKPNKQYDVVMSLGFIEHFSDVDEIVNLHLKWLKPNGILILGIPNFRGIYYGIQKILDTSVLDKHNLDIMNLDYFKYLANQFDLKPMFIDYIGSFEPALPLRKPGKVRPLQFCVRGFLWLTRYLRKFSIFDQLNNRFFSSYILAVYNRNHK